MKTCNRCKLSKAVDEFGNNKRYTDGKQPYCKLCAKLQNAKYYVNYPERRREYNQKSMAAAQQFIWDHLKANPCMDCPEDDPIVLQFDHVRGTKLFNLGEAAGLGYSITKIESEIAKCDVRCANCHIRQTAARGNWYQRIDTT